MFRLSFRSGTRLYNNPVVLSSQCERWRVFVFFFFRNVLCIREFSTWSRSWVKHEPRYLGRSERRARYCHRHIISIYCIVSFMHRPLQLMMDNMVLRTMRIYISKNVSHVCWMHHCLVRCWLERVLNNFALLGLEYYRWSNEESHCIDTSDNPGYGPATDCHRHPLNVAVNHIKVIAGLNIKVFAIIHL